MSDRVLPYLRLRKAISKVCVPLWFMIAHCAPNYENIFSLRNLTTIFCNFICMAQVQLIWTYSQLLLGHINFQKNLEMVLWKQCFTYLKVWCLESNIVASLKRLGQWNPYCRTFYCHLSGTKMSSRRLKHDKMNEYS